MKAIYNSRILDEAEIGLQISNRAFCYGDGLFETIVTGPGRINLIPYHIARLSKACELLDLEMPFDASSLEQHITLLKKQNQLTGTVRIRVQLWRETGGLYAPDKTEGAYLITVAPTNKPFYSSIRQISISQEAKVTWHALSFAKTMSAMPYVVAGLEQKSSTYDDLIITDSQGNIAEAIISNIFWVSNGEIFTPSLDTGCIDGTMRQYVLKQFRDHGISVIQTKSQPVAMRTAEHVFLSNAAGIQWVESFENEILYKDPKALLTKAAILPPEL